MPLVKVEIIKGKDAAYRQAVLESVHTGLVNALGIGDWDRFQRLYELEDDCFQRSGSKTDRFTMIEITMFPGRTKAQKAAVFQNIVNELGRSPGIEATDIFIVIQEPPDENWGLAGKQRNTD